jgi:hypothetical protein
MIRIVIENIFLFMLPTVLYLAWVAFTENEWAGLPTVVREAPLVRLFVAGAALMLATLVTFSSQSHNSPQDVYVPPSVEDGRIEPGHTLPAPQPEPVKP